MNEKKLEKLRKAGLNPKDFEPNESTDSERIDILEEAIIELAEMIVGGGLDG